MKRTIVSISFSVLISVMTLGNVTNADELVVITAPDNSEELQLSDVARIFLGKARRFPSGAEVEPLDIDPSNPSYAEFARLVLKKTPSQLRAYWAKQMFTGKGRPPKVLASPEQLREMVARHKRYLSYLEENQVDETVRPVITVE